MNIDVEKLKRIYKKNNSNIKLKPELIKLLEETNNESKTSVLSDNEQDEIINELFNQVYHVLPNNSEKTKNDIINAIATINKLIVLDAINTKKTLRSNDKRIINLEYPSQNMLVKPYADISAFINWSEWVGIYDLSSQPSMNKTNNTCDLSYVSTYFSTIPNQCISGNLNDGKFKLLTHDLSNILKNTLLEVNFSTKGIFSKSGSLELVMKNGSDYSIDARSVYPDKARTMCYGPQFFKTNDLSRNNLHFHLDLSLSNGDFIFSENPRLTLKLRNLL